ncbi:MAG: metal-dependent transcriptional regulator [Thermoplasmata archaeon]|nr:MAG: metal-dependent transcriptional regulator [Thermoplasmata archaeon]
MELKRREEDYLEAIYEISKRKGKARTTDLAEYLGIKPASVTEMLQKLAAKGLLEYHRYSGVVLSKKGEEVALSVRERHDTIRELLKYLQVPPDIAQRDACIMEHNLSPITIIQLKKFINFIKNCPKNAPIWLEHFKKYSETGEFDCSEECEEKI